MAKRKELAIVGDISECEGRCLRYVVSTSDQPVEPTRLINQIEWSWLPKSYLEAKKAFENLLKLKLVRKQSKRGYTFTDLGVAVVSHADKAGMWRSTSRKPPEAPEYKPSPKPTKKRTKRKGGSK